MKRLTKIHQSFKSFTKDSPAESLLCSVGLSFRGKFQRFKKHNRTNLFILLLYIIYR